MTWNYRVFRHHGIGPGDTTIPYFKIHEAYYDEEDNFHGMTQAVYPQGETIEELRDDLDWMIKALDAPVLEWPDDEKEETG